MRVVIDTNVIISSYLSPTGIPAQILQQWDLNAFDLLVSDPILQEYQTVFLYPHLQALHHLNQVEVAAIIARFRKFGILITPLKELTVIEEDPEDNKFLSCGIAGQAEVIVSGDSDLLHLKTYEGTHILTPHAFLTVLQAEQAA